MSRKDVLQAMQRTADGSHGSWNCPLDQTDYHQQQQQQQQQQCRENKDDDDGISGDVITPPTLHVEANEGGLLFGNNSQMGDKPEPLTRHINHHIQEGFRDDDASFSCSSNSSKRENFRVVTVGAEFEDVKRRRKEENCLGSTEILSSTTTATATDGHGGGSNLWDAPLVHTDYISKVSEDNASSTERCSGSWGNRHRPLLLSLLQCKGRASNNIGSNHYQPPNDQEELGECLGIKEANKG